MPMLVPNKKYPAEQLFSLFGLADLVMARRRLLTLDRTNAARIAGLEDG